MNVPSQRIEIRWHGRGGQGAVTAAVVTAQAAIYEGKYAQAYPEFGAERRGAPVNAYTRISTQPIYTRSPILHPDVVVVLDSTLPWDLVLRGLKENGIVVVNTKKSPGEIREIIKREDVKIAVVDANKIALEKLGVPIVNTAMIGALVRAVPLVKLESVIKAVKETFPGRLGEANAEAIKSSYEVTQVA
ncbi:MAG: pyruvate synthase [Thermoprotei archaeon]|nr:MAG: pyruvate synthase [Thermoprotei archaeon]